MTTNDLAAITATTVRVAQRLTPVQYQRWQLEDDGYGFIVRRSVRPYEPTDDTERAVLSAIQAGERIVFGYTIEELLNATHRHQNDQRAMHGQLWNAFATIDIAAREIHDAD